MKSTNRRWQNHLRAKGPIAFFLDRLQTHALSTDWQEAKGTFNLPIEDRERDDELSKSFFEMTELFPYDFLIEVTNHCNLNCLMCARKKMTRPQGSMSLDLFKKIIDEIAEKQPFAYLHYYGIGEPLCDPGLFEKLDYARQKKLCNSIIFSNGQLLPEKENYKRLAESGVSTVGVDLDGFSQEVYGKIRVGGQFLKAKTGIEKLYDHVRRQGLKTRVELAFHVYSGVNDKDAEAFIAWCEANQYEYKLVSIHSWAGLRDDNPNTEVQGLPKEYHGAKRCACWALWSNFFITWTGAVGLCLRDANGTEILGDVSRQSIQEVWMGEHLKKRREHLQGIHNGLCAQCDSYGLAHLPPFGSTFYPKSLR